MTATTFLIATGPTSGAGPDARTSALTSSDATSTTAAAQSRPAPTRPAGAKADGKAADRPVVPALLPQSHPERLLIPTIDVDVEVMDLGLLPDGTLEVPPGAFPAGWYDGSPTPGELGPAILAGHVHYDETPGVFERLGELDAGDEVEVLRADGSTASFTVTRTEDYAKSAFPTDTVYGDIDHAGLRLITCGGLDAETGAYEDNVVVFAELTGTASP
ncbi:class F sortase [Nocardioides dongxiaopingii]|uniref:class F sortase n=1 Tax=Nocardioides sp. S-1144 TaxID=2582905 RepID=UPI0011647C54|nr:class F sortase [Nocardioides sp. S-1144]QCW51155.2 class F sortase [Nocardioides sp. S-1144]